MEKEDKKKEKSDTLSRYFFMGDYWKILPPLKVASQIYGGRNRQRVVNIYSRTKRLLNIYLLLLVIPFALIGLIAYNDTSIKSDIRGVTAEMASKEAPVVNDDGVVEKIDSKEKAKAIIGKLSKRSKYKIRLTIYFCGGLLALAFLFSIVCQLSPLFNENKKLKKKLLDEGIYRQEDEDSNTLTVWTPDGILLKTSNCTPSEAKLNKRLWATLSIDPGAHYTAEDQTIFFIERKFNLARVYDYTKK